MIIDSNTLFYGSFSKIAGNVGCSIFNTCFQYYGINAIYKSFSITNIEDAVNAAKCLKFSGFAVSMPFKKDIIQYLDYFDECVKKTNSCNTVIIKNNKLYGYNTDYYSINEFLEDYFAESKTPQNFDPDINNIYILGNGSYANTLKTCCNEKNIQYSIITRDNWDDIKELKNSFVFNCTPVENIDIDDTNILIQSINTTLTGRTLALKQASHQFKLYTNMDFPSHLFLHN